MIVRASCRKVAAQACLALIFFAAVFQSIPSAYILLFCVLGWEYVLYALSDL